MAPKSRADYFKERRKATRALYVEIDTETMEKFEKALSKEGKTKKEWLLEKIHEVIG